MHHKDLSVFKDGNIEFPSVLTIGWLSPERAYSKGVVADSVIQQLKRISGGKDAYDARSNTMRGAIQCKLCDDFRLQNPSELWIESITEGEYYIAPELIIHYIEDHHYKPPEAFLSAVEQIDLNKPFSGQDIEEQLMKQVGYSDLPVNRPDNIL